MGICLLRWLWDEHAGQALGSPRFAHLKLLLVFKNKDLNYPIHGVPDYVEDVSYRTGLKDWMENLVIPQCISESSVIRRLRRNLRHVLYVDNCSGKIPLWNLWRPQRLLKLRFDIYLRT